MERTKPIRGKMTATSNYARGPRNAAGRRSYLYDDEVLPPKLVKAVRTVFKGHCKLFTVKAGGHLNAAEEACGDKLAWEVRFALNTPTQGSILLFVRGSRNKMNGTRDLTLHLLNQGYPIKVIALALNRHEITLRKYRLGRFTALQHVPLHKRNLEIGYNLFREQYSLPKTAGLERLCLVMKKEPTAIRTLANEIGSCYRAAKVWAEENKDTLFEELREPAPAKSAIVETPFIDEVIEDDD